MGPFRVDKISSDATNQVSHDKVSAETTPNGYVSKFRDSSADANIEGKNSVSSTSHFRGVSRRKFPLLLVFFSLPVWEILVWLYIMYFPFLQSFL